MGQVEQQVVVQKSKEGYLTRQYSSFICNAFAHFAKDDPAWRV